MTPEAQDDGLQLGAYIQAVLGLLAFLFSLAPAVISAVGHELAADDAAGGRLIPSVGALAFPLAGVLFAAVGIAGARALIRRRNFALARASAAILCLFLPLGTLAGWYLLSRLADPAVREQFH